MDTSCGFIKKHSEKTVFLAGGITNCPNWQKEIINLLRETDLILFNPRRTDFDVKNKDSIRDQIAWEYKYLKNCNSILFWFSSGSINPIVLFEYGRWSYISTFFQYKPIFCGIDPGYIRNEDVEIQTELLHSDIKIVRDLDSLAKQLIFFELHNYNKRNNHE